MINPTDLRLGNHIYYNSEPFHKVVVKVEVTDLLDIHDGESYEPIPLTEDILVNNLGAKEAHFKHFAVYPKIYTIGNISFWWESGVKLATFNQYFKYLHQLENAIYLMTGRELEVKLEGL